jgi:hypothetical protein
MPKLIRYGIDEMLPPLRKHAPEILGDPMSFGSTIMSPTLIPKRKPMRLASGSTIVSSLMRA